MIHFKCGLYSVVIADKIIVYYRIRIVVCLTLSFRAIAGVNRDRRLLNGLLSGYDH